MVIESQYAILEKVAIYSVAIPIFTAMFKIKTLNKALWVLVFYLLMCLLTDQLSLILINNTKRVNSLLNFFTIIEYILISTIYHFNFSSKKIKISNIVLGSLFLLFATLVLIIKGYYFVDTLISPVESVLLTIFAGIYLVVFLMDNRITKPRRHYFYWINLAFLLYFSVGIVLFMSGGFLSHCTSKTFFIIWGIHLILNIAKNILLGIGIWMKQDM